MKIEYINFKPLKIKSLDQDLSRIREAFKEYFKGQLQLPEKIGSKGKLDSNNTGWIVSYLLGHNTKGEPFLDFTAEHRMTDLRHHRIDKYGNISFQKQYMKPFTYDPNIPGDRERKSGSET